MNLLGLLLSSVLRRTLADRAVRRRIRAMHANVVVDGAGMCVTLAFDDGAVVVSRGACDQPDAVVQGSLSGLLDAALGRNRLRRVLRGELSARGNPIVVWRLLSLLRPGGDGSASISGGQAEVPS
jgi:ubiquinone biosynthesis protein UbiJ